MISEVLRTGIEPDDEEDAQIKAQAESEGLLVRCSAYL